ncbi:MAG: hypothetical protein R2706_14240 [Acidimicrobiales bacterium]
MASLAVGAVVASGGVAATAAVIIDSPAEPTPVTQDASPEAESAIEPMAEPVYDNGTAGDETSEFTPVEATSDENAVEGDESEVPSDEPEVVEDEACEEAANHGEYVSGVAKDKTPSEDGANHGAAVKAAAQSDCGKADQTMADDQDIDEADDMDATDDMDDHDDATEIDDHGDAAKAERTKNGRNNNGNSDKPGKD